MPNAYTGFADLYDMLMSDVDYDDWCAYLARLLQAYADEQGAFSIADCACGTGNVSVRLACRGFGVTGSDLSADMLRIAQDKAMHVGLRVPFVCQDMRDFSMHRQQDAVLACCDGVNYLTSPEDVSSFFAAAYRALRPGGLLLFDVSTAYKLDEILGTHTYGEDTEHCTYLWQNVYDPDSRLLEMHLSFFLPEGQVYRRFDEVHVQRAHTEEELRALLEENGFILVDVFDAFTTEPPRADSERTQWIARKKP